MALSNNPRWIDISGGNQIPREFLNGVVKKLKERKHLEFWPYVHSIDSYRPFNSKMDGLDWATLAIK
jgi:hypothetical protein